MLVDLDALYQFQNPSYLELALTHRSFANEKGATSLHNERLEFLGDSVLGAALSARLMSEFPEENEGTLSKRRASLVNEERLAQLAIDLGMSSRIKLGRGEVKTGGALKPRILACGFEAYIGAIFLDGGFESARQVIDQLFAPYVDSLKTSGIDFQRDYKTRLQEWAHLNRQVTPIYSIVEEAGPAHARIFEVAVRIEGQAVQSGQSTQSGQSNRPSNLPPVIASGMGKSKKAAEQEAARAALLSLDVPLVESPTETMDSTNPEEKV